MISYDYYVAIFTWVIFRVTQVGLLYFLFIYLFIRFV